MGLSKSRVARRVLRTVLPMTAITVLPLLCPAPASAAPDLSLSGSDAPDPTTVGVRLTYTLTLVNLGDDPAPGSTLTVTIPPSADPIAVSAGLGSCALGRPTVCSLGTLGLAGAVSIVLSVRPTAPGTLTLTARTGPADASPANDSLTLTTGVGLKPGACANPRIGTTLDDMLDGTAGGDSMFGHGGKDAIDGREGDDCLEGADGDDRLDGASGADRVSGGADDDALAGRSGSDRLIRRRWG